MQFFSTQSGRAGQPGVRAKQTAGPLRWSRTARIFAGLVVASLSLATGCAETVGIEPALDPSHRSEASTDGGPSEARCAVDADCTTGFCVRGVCNASESPAPATPAGAGAPGPQGPRGWDAPAQPTSDVPADTTPSASAAPTASDAGGAEGRTLYRGCRTDSDCPVLGTRCVTELRFSHGWQEGVSAPTVPIEDLAVDALDAPGVCSVDCTRDGQAACDEIEDGDRWTCQVLDHVDLYALWVDRPEGLRPADDAVLAAFAVGNPFVAACRPPAMGDEPLCAACHDDDACGAGGVCVRDRLADGASGAGICATPCSAAGVCPFGFACAEGLGCVPVSGACGECLDRDGNGYGTGHCPHPGIDCDDLDPAAYFAPGRVPPVSGCGFADRNCNGVHDEDELVGPGGIAPHLHCRHCDDPCNDDVLALQPDAPNVGAECRFADNALQTAVCEAGCASGFASCDGTLTTGCETDLGAVASCGACGVDCTAGEGVEAVSCADLGVGDEAREGLRGPFACRIDRCEEGLESCDGDPLTGCETDIASDLANCGACGASCPAYPNTHPVCAGGVCEIAGCVDGFGSCDGLLVTGCETPLRTSIDHCGACGHSCRGENVLESRCQGGGCVIDRCRSGYANCDGNTRTGCEVELASDTENCGACGMNCGGLPNVASARCGFGRCEIVACEAGFSNCDGNVLTGCEADLRSTDTHCGTCGNDCSAQPNVAGGICVQGACEVVWCDPGFGSCDGSGQSGCETSLRTLTDCGGCGQTCDPVHPDLGASCATGSCRCVDAAPRQICDGRRSRCAEGVDEGCPARVGVHGGASQWHYGANGSPSQTCNSGSNACAGSIQRQFLRGLTWGVLPTAGTHCPLLDGQCSRGVLGGPGHCGEIEHPIVGFENYHDAQGRIIGFRPIRAALSLVPDDGAPGSGGNFARYRVTRQLEEGQRFGEAAGHARIDRVVCDAPNAIVVGLDVLRGQTHDRPIYGLRLSCRGVEARLVAPSSANPADRYRMEAARDQGLSHVETSASAWGGSAPNAVRQVVLEEQGLRPLVAVEYLFGKTDFMCHDTIDPRSRLLSLGAITRLGLTVQP